MPLISVAPPLRGDEQGIGAEAVVVVEILVTEREAENPLPNHDGDGLPLHDAFL